LHTESPLEHDEVTVETPILLHTAARFAGSDEEELVLLNPALSEAVREGRASVPRNYELRIPVGAAAEFLKAYTPWRIEEEQRLAALERARKAKLAASKKTKRTRNKRTVISAKSEKRNSVRAAQADGKAKKPRG